MAKIKEYTKSGQPVYEYDDKESDGWTPPEFGEEGWCERLEWHFERYCGKADMVFHEVLSDRIHLDVHWVKPTPERNYHTLFTTGMSFLPMKTPPGLENYRYAELMVCLPPEWPISDEAFQDERHYWPVRWMKFLARFPHDYDTWLGSCHTMPAGNPPEPLSTDTKMNGFILLPSVLTDPGIHTLQMDAEHAVQVYCVVPLYQEEMDFKLKHGAQGLLDRFDKHGYTERIDLKRKNVCKPSLFSFLRR